MSDPTIDPAVIGPLPPAGPPAPEPGLATYLDVAVATVDERRRIQGLPPLLNNSGQALILNGVLVSVHVAEIVD